MKEKIKNLIQKIKALPSKLETPKYILIAFLVILVIGLAALKFSAPKTRPEPSLPPLKEPQIEENVINRYPVRNIKFSGQAPQFPQKLPLYLAQNPQSLITYCQKIAQKLGLDEGNYLYNWRQNNLSLTCNPQRNSVRLTQPIPDEGEKPNLNQGQEIIKTYLSQMEIELSQFSLDETATEYLLVGGNEFVSTKPEKAEFIRLGYQKILSSQPVFQKDSNLTPLFTLIGPGNSMVEINYFPFLADFEELREYPLISIEQAITLLNQGKGNLLSLLYTSQDQNQYLEIPFEISRVQSANLTEVELVYLYEPKETYLIPSYIFSGEGTASDGRKVSLSLFISALDPQYFTKP